MATYQQIEQLTSGALGDGVVYLPAFSFRVMTPFRNKEGSGPMLDENFETWINLMHGDHEERDRARRHKGGWNARAIAALCELPAGEVQAVWEECHHLFREEWLNDHGVGLILRKVTDGFQWLNGIATAVLTAIGGWAWIGAAIGAVLAPVLKKQQQDQEEHEEELELKEGALAWFQDRALPPPPDSSTWPSVAMFLQQMEDDQGWGRDQEISWLTSQGLVAAASPPAPSSPSSSPSPSTSTGAPSPLPSTASIGPEVGGGLGLAVAAGLLLAAFFWS